MLSNGAACWSDRVRQGGGCSQQPGGAGAVERFLAERKE